jgi:uncharacterized repeat protein (TIGR03803 family)
VTQPLNNVKRPENWRSFMSERSWWKTACALSLLCAATTIASPAQTFTTLYKFAGSGNPDAGLLQGTDGGLYGTTRGFEGSSGTVFKITPSGTLTEVGGFDGGDGKYPEAAVVEGTDGNFYGTTFEGGNPGNGTVFKITPSGTLTLLYSFGFAPSGSFPIAALIQAKDGNFYGTTLYGGANSCVFGGTDYGCGTIFKITPSGTLTTLYNFCSQSGCTDGELPEAALVQASNGNLYGTTDAGGASTACTDGCGTVFEITTTGTRTTLHSFDNTDGANPTAGLIQATDGNFYGTTYSGGASSNSCSPSTGTCGTVFKITSAGTLTTLHRFDATDGANPIAGLIQASDGSLYGTTRGGPGTIFKITLSGTLTTLFNFDGTDGDQPNALVQDTNGTFYGTTESGGNDNYHFCGGGCGTVFSLSVGLGPFVEVRSASGKEGTTVKILGTRFAGATSVSFNGTAASFNVISSSEITTTVPAGATTGEIKVVTPSGTLSSNVPFHVLP